MIEILIMALLSLFIPAFCINGKLNWAVNYVQIILFIMTAITVFVLLYALPSSEDGYLVIGSSYPTYSVITSIFLLLIIFASFRGSFGEFGAFRLKVSPLGAVNFLLLPFTCLLLYVGYWSFLLNVYNNNLLQSSPVRAMILAFSMALISLISMYISSIFKFKTKPNLIYSIVIFLVYCLAILVFWGMFLFLYAMPSVPPSVYPDLTSILNLTFIPMSLFLLIIKNTFLKDLANPSMNADC